MPEIPNSPLINVERVVISSIIFDPSKFEEMIDLLEPGDFIHLPHRSIFEACLELYGQDLPLDEGFIRTRLPKNKVSDEEFFYVLSSNPITNVEAYVKEIKNASMKRQFNKLANSLREKSLDEGANGEELLDEVEKQIYSISMKNVQSDFRESREVTLSTVEWIKDMKAKGNNFITGLNTGFHRLNKVTTGFNKGELIIIGARPSMGKTALALGMAQTVLNLGKGAAIFSLEMPAEQLMLRLLSPLASIPLQDLKTGNLDDSQWRELSRCADVMSSKELFIDEGSSLSINQLRSKLRKLKSRQPNVEIAFIDYLQLMRSSNRRNDMMRQEEISEISRGLKTLARELEIPIVALSQLNRSLESRDDKRPMLSDLRESGAIEQDADVILFLYRDSYYREQNEKQKLARMKNSEKVDDKAIRAYETEIRRSREEEHKSGKAYEAELIVAKNRNGETKTVKIRWNGKFTRFEDVIGEGEIDYVPAPTKFESNEKIELPDF